MRALVIQQLLHPALYVCEGSGALSVTLASHSLRGGISNVAGSLRPVKLGGAVQINFPFKRLAMSPASGHYVSESHVTVILTPKLPN